MTKKELTEIMAKYPDDTEIMVNGYEGGFTSIKNVKQVDVFYSPSNYCGEWNEWDAEDAKEYNGMPLQPEKKVLIFQRNEE